MLFHRMMMMIDLVINNLSIVKVIRSRYHWHKVGLSVTIPRNIDNTKRKWRIYSIGIKLCTVVKGPIKEIDQKILRS